MESGSCPFCLRDNVHLHKSHIFPELLYKACYDETTHKATVLRTDVHYNSRIGKGFRQRLFCTPCEARFQEFEDYFAKVWYQNPGLPECMSGKLDSDNFFQMTTLDMNLVKLFHLSVLWRANITTRDEFDNVDLSEAHSERLRQLLRNKKAEAHEHYFIYGTLLLGPNEKVLHGIVSKPQVTSELNGVTYFYSVYGGVEWVFGVSDQPNYPKDSILSDVEPLLLKKDKPLRLWARPFKKTNTFRVMREQLKTRPQAPRKN